VGFREVVETSLQMCIVLDYASGGELFEYVADKRAMASEQDIQCIFAQIADGMIHTDLHSLSLFSYFPSCSGHRHTLDSLQNNAGFTDWYPASPSYFFCFLSLAVDYLHQLNIVHRDLKLESKSASIVTFLTSYIHWSTDRDKISTYISGQKKQDRALSTIKEIHSQCTLNTNGPTNKLHTAEAIDILSSHETKNDQEMRNTD
jgi:hypothetical protein